MVWVAPVVVILGSIGLMVRGRRIQPAEGTANPVVSKQLRYAPIALVGHLPGVLMAGFMGAFLQLSILQTGGIGWAWTTPTRLGAVRPVVS